MLRNECKIGQKVYFGNEFGEKTLGEIVKLNPTKAKVKTLENRGINGRSVAGSIWNVPYAMMTPESASAITQPQTKRIQYNRFDLLNNLILEAILSVYSSLSPESLTCDGERSPSEVFRVRKQLEEKLRYLCLAYGENVSEEQIYAWWDSKAKHVD